MPRALVVGAGLAGLTAAMDLADAGVRVTLVERRPFAGGRTFSFTNPGGDLLDNGQHVFLGCCTAYLALLDRLGARGDAYLQERLDIRIVDAADGPARLREAPLPAPLHLLPALLALRYLSAGEKLAAIAALLAIRFRRLPEDRTFASWLATHGQSANAIQRLWNLIVIPTCNAPAERVSAAMGGFVFREGLLSTRGGGRLGYSRVPLSHIVPDRAVAYLHAREADVRFGTTVRSVDADGAVTSQGERLAAEATIVAVPPQELAGLALGSWAGPAAELETAPIVGVNLWYDRPLFDGEVLAAIVDGEAHWLFDRTRILGLAAGEAHHIAVSISAAEGAVATPRSELAGRVAAMLAKAVPAAREALLLRSSVEKVASATFVPGPDSARKRLGSRTPVPHLFLAGAWTDTRWPDTMESAVRSGHAAARLAQHFLQEAPH